jgi:hypothetical protein
MAGIYPDEGLRKVAELITGFSANGNLTMRLFVNNITPGAATVKADFTECTLTGYTSKTLNTSNWTFGISSSVETASYPQQNWVFTASGQTIYGYYVTDPTDAKVVWCERIASPYAVPSGGGSIQITPTISDLNN